jgi:tRNA nucleotidyltransferase (CCA-adding enzyme)
MPAILKYRKSDLEKTLSLGQLALLRIVAGVAAARHLPLYLVGGFVRDMLLGFPATDFDLVVEGDAISLARELAAQHGGRVTAHARFGTAQWFPIDPGNQALDLTSTRSETYKHTAALPSVKSGALIDDLVRRDFTINTLSVRLDGGHWGELRDELGGLDDLKRGQVRILHPESFRDDPTRLFRAVRYEQRYDFRIVPETLSLMPQAQPLIAMLSAQRIQRELDLVLDEQNSVAMLSRLAELDLLQPVHPALTWNKAILEHFLKGSRRLPEYPIQFNPPLDKNFLGWHFWLMEVASIDLESLERRLHFSANLYNSLLAASELFADLPFLIGLKPSQWVARLENLPLAAVCAVFLASPEEKAHANLFNYLETWRHIKPKTNGHDLKKRGLPPGPRYQQVLQRLRAAWLDEEVKTETEEMELLELLTKLV